MRRFPWVSVALLIVLGLLAALSYRLFYEDNSGEVAGDAEPFANVYMAVGGVCSILALVIGALGVWARAPATLPTALGIVGAGAFAAAWLAKLAGTGGDAAFAGYREGFILMFTGVLIAFAASARRVAAPSEV